MKKAPNPIMFIVVTIMYMVLAAGCTFVQKNDAQIMFIEKFSPIIVEYSERFFEKEISIEDFDISVAEEISPNMFNQITDLDGANPVYCIGHFKGEPEDVLEFILVYDPEKNEVIQFGISTIESNEMQLVEISEIKER